MTQFRAQVGSVARMTKRSIQRAAAAVTPRQRGDRPLWVLGGSAGREYCDNASALHRFLLRERPDVDAVWVIDRRSADVGMVATVGPWVDHGSVEAHRLIASADVVAFSHGVHDLPGLLHNRNATIARLGHGLTAFKKTKDPTTRSVRRMTRRVDVAPVASAFEREHKGPWGFETSELPITGLPRWDLMKEDAASSPRQDEVLYALTWRDWITPSTLEKSEYWQQLSRLADRLWRPDEAGLDSLRPGLFLHPLVRAAMAPRLDSLPTKPRLVSGGSQLPAALARSALLVTDYSSLAWDALYLGVPVIFFHFDRAQFVARHGSYVDLGSRLFGPTAETVDELHTYIGDFLANDRRLVGYKNDQAAWASRAFAFTDDDNCRRVVEAIEQRGR